MLINFHTHLLQQPNDHKIIYNLAIPDSEESLENFEEILAEIPENIYLSVGIHPWFINENLLEKQFEILSQLANNQQVKLIGECGLDRIKGVNLKLQEAIFIKQIRIAEDVKKPLIIHCVKCFSELFSIKKIIRPRVPMILHGFNQNLEIGEELLKKQFYLSLGTAILHENSNAEKILAVIPLENLFLETDDKEISIEEIYKKAAKIRKISDEKLEEIIFENFLNLQF